MYFEPKKKKYERKTIKGRILASKISGFNSDKVVFYIKHNGAKKRTAAEGDSDLVKSKEACPLNARSKQRFIALLKNNNEAKGYYLNYSMGAFVEITYLDTFFPLIIKMEKI